MWHDNLQKIVTAYSKPGIPDVFVKSLQKSLDEPDELKSKLLFMEAYDILLREKFITPVDLIIFNVIIGDAIVAMTSDERTKFEVSLDHQREVFRLRN
jgi:hypothetical protein